MQEISGQEVRDLFPLCRVDDILSGFYAPTDGRVNPVDAAMSLAKGARMKGAKIIEGVTVAGVTERVVNGRRSVSGVITSDGNIRLHLRALVLLLLGLYLYVGCLSTV